MRAITENQISIYKNAIVHQGKTTLYYSIAPYNYSLYSDYSISTCIDRMYNTITSIDENYKGLQFSLFRFQDLLPASQFLDEFIATIRIWDENFVPTPQFIENLSHTTQEYCFIAINIDDKKSIDVNNISLKNVVKDVRDNLASILASSKQQMVDTERLDTLIKSINDIGQSILRPVPEDILVSYYIKRVFPYYNIVIPRDDLDSNKAILSYLQQDLTPHFNYFEMSNSGIEILGGNAKAKKTYATVIDIVEFPDAITSENFALNHNGIVVNCKLLSKQEAKVKISRKQKDIEYEEESAEAVGNIQQAVDIQEYHDIAENALACISAGRRIVEADIHILIVSDDLDDLHTRRQGLISALKEMGVIATFSPDQAKAYIDSFVKLRPREYPYLMELRYPLSFRLNHGAQAGDFDSDFTSPIFGVTVSASEATD